MSKPNKALKLLSAGVVFLIGAVLPLVDGDPVNTTLLSLAAVFVFFAVTAWIVAMKTSASTHSRPSAG